MKLAIKLIFVTAIAALFNQCSWVGSINHTRILRYSINDSLISEAKYELTISKVDSGYCYEYWDLNREKQSIKYIRSGQSVYQGGIKFTTLKFGDFSFKKNNLDEFDLLMADGDFVDGPGPLLFNDKYGVLYCSGAWGNNTLFLPENGKSKMDRMVLENVKSK